ncbi:uncharacterized protein LOC119733727 [Patiria miniata]|uniref:Uncharacterized protein n=1 Tax=Patiria miniata TaxID=46514 RepID=A0A914AHM9_PATMI|nr:uncharacterized protein LOC119733727 [Patiria miniata]
MKREQLEQIEDDLPLHQLQGQTTRANNAFREIVHRAGQLRAEINDLEQQSQNVQLPFGTGPIASSLDSALVKHNVCRQAYHGKAFVGNHVHKCCQVSTDFSGLSVQCIINYLWQYKEKNL